MHWRFRYARNRSRGAAAVAGLVLFVVAALATAVRVSQSRPFKRLVVAPLGRLQRWGRSLAAGARFRALPAAPTGSESHPAGLEAQTPEPRSA